MTNYNCIVNQTNILSKIDKTKACMGASVADPGGRGLTPSLPASMKITTGLLFEGRRGP